MPRSELAAAALALALIICACPAFPSQAEAEQSAALPASLTASQPVSDASSVKPAEAQDREDRMDDAEALRKLEETDRLMRWLNESALWTGTSERTRARSIRFR